jgi:hypothetical protein
VIGANLAAIVRPKISNFSSQNIFGLPSGIRRPNSGFQTFNTPISHHIRGSLDFQTPLFKLNSVASTQTRPSAGLEEGNCTSTSPASHLPKERKTAHQQTHPRQEKIGKFFLKSNFGSKQDKNSTISIFETSKGKPTILSVRVVDFPGKMSSRVHSDSSSFPSTNGTVPPKQLTQVPKTSQKLNLIKSVFSSNADITGAERLSQPLSRKSPQRLTAEFNLITDTQTAALEHLFQNESLLFTILTTICEEQDLYQPFRTYWNQSADFDFEEIVVG